MALYSNTLAAMSQIQILHNPRCSKSRQTLQLLTERGFEPEIIEYLKTPPTSDQLAEILTKLGLEAAQLLRKKEAEYKALNLDSQQDSASLLNAMSQHPKLIERPIVIKGDQARIGRPPEAVLEIL